MYVCLNSILVNLLYELVLIVLDCCMHNKCLGLYINLENTDCLIMLGTYSTIDDSQLDELTRQACDEHPGIGIRILKGFLLSKGFRVQRERIRRSLLRIDPIGIVQRWKSTVKRRQYNVKHPLSLWHIDGNHKLIRYLL